MLHIVEDLKKLAQLSTANHKHAAAIIRGKTVLATGINYPLCW